jgi:hypothetical protein
MMELHMLWNFPCFDLHLMLLYWLSLMLRGGAVLLTNWCAYRCIALDVFGSGYQWQEG